MIDGGDRMRLDGFVRSVFDCDIIGVVSSFFQSCHGKAIAVGCLLGVLYRVITIATRSKGNIEQLTIGVEGEGAEYLIAFLDDNSVGVCIAFCWPCNGNIVGTRSNDHIICWHILRISSHALDISE